jgi:hypothetical protein
MALFPLAPVPSHVSAPAIIDPVLSYQVDAGYTVRRARTSRPRRRYTLDYLGQTTEALRIIRDFILTQRANVIPCQFWHPTAIDIATFQATTPVLLSYAHGLITGQWLGIVSGPSSLIGFWQITRLDAATLALNGSSGAGPGGQVSVVQYLPNAIVVYAEDTAPTPATIIGPDQVISVNRRSGYYSWTVLIEEVF